jgi:hypothetical protein
LDLNPQISVEFKIAEKRNRRIVFQNNYALDGKVPNPQHWTPHHKHPQYYALFLLPLGLGFVSKT